MRKDKNKPPNGSPPWRNGYSDETLYCADDIDRLPLFEMGPCVVITDPFDAGIERMYPNPYFNGIERIGSFKEYLMSHFYTDYTGFLRSLLTEGRLDVGKPGMNIYQPERIGIGEISILRIDLYRKSTTEVYADIIMVADLTYYDHIGQNEYKENLSQWFRLRTVADLSPDNLSFNNFEFAAVYERLEKPPGCPLDDYLVPYTSAALLDSEAMELLALYYPQALETPCRVTGEELARRMKLNVKYCRLAEDSDIRGQLYFEERVITVLDRQNRKCRKKIAANTIIVDISAVVDDEMNFRKELLDDTVIHECYHADRHRLFYLGQRLYNEDIRCLSCSTSGIQMGKAIDAAREISQSADIDEAVVADVSLSSKSPIDWIEWQANRVTPRIRMPEKTTEQMIDRLRAQYRSRYPHMSAEKLTERIICELADFYGVSKQSAKLRMIELGHSEAQGILNFANGAYVENHSFAPDSLSQNQTFTIGFKEALELYRDSKAFRDRINSGCYQYIDGHYCLAQSKYVYRRAGVLHLTSHAKHHMDECCLVFTVSGGRIEYTYKEGTLQKEVVTTGVRTEYSEIQPALFDFRAEANRLSEILYSLPASPSETLKKHMERCGITVEELMAKSGVSESTIRRLRTNPSYKAVRNNALAICIGLQLEPPLQKDWLRKCGVALSDSPDDLLYEMMLCSMYRQPLSSFNEKLKEYGYPPLSKCTEELDA